MADLTQFLADCWRMFTEVDVPGIGITFGQLYLGVFVVGISIIILRPLLGIGGGFVNLMTGAAKRGYDHAYNKRNRQAEYDKHRMDRIADHSTRPGNVHIIYKSPKGYSR